MSLKRLALLGWLFFAVAFVAVVALILFLASSREKPRMGVYVEKRTIAISRASPTVFATGCAPKTRVSFRFLLPGRHTPESEPRSFSVLIEYGDPRLIVHVEGDVPPQDVLPQEETARIVFYRGKTDFGAWTNYEKVVFHVTPVVALQMRKYLPPNNHCTM